MPTPPSLFGSNQMLTSFDPVQYSMEENAFLREQLGKPPIVALRVIPQNVIRKAVEPIISDVYALMELERAEGKPWVGVPALVEKIDAYVEQQQKWQEDKKRGAPRFPSMFAFDTKGRPHRAGIGSDSGQVKTYFDASGQRVPFAVDLVPSGVEAWNAPWVASATPKPDEPESGLKVDAEQNRIECRVCGYTESFNANSRASYNAARGRMSRHLRNSTEKVEEHRELHTMEFGG